MCFQPTQPVAKYPLSDLAPPGLVALCPDSPSGVLTSFCLLSIEQDFSCQCLKVDQGLSTSPRITDDIRDCHFNGPVHCFFLVRRFEGKTRSPTPPTFTMLPVPKPTDFATDFPAVARSVAFGIVFMGIYYYLKPYGSSDGA